MTSYLYLEAFRIQKNLMTLTGIWPRDDLGWWYKLYGFIISLAIQLAFMMPSMILVFSDSTTVSEASYILFCNITIITYFLKLIVLYLKRHLFHKILNDLEQPLFLFYDNRFEYCMKNTVVILIRVRKLIHFPCIAFIIFIAAFPLLDKNSAARPLPFGMPFDINQLSFSLYVTIYCMEVLASAVCACNNGNVDTLSCSLIALGTAQLEILGEKLKILATISGSTSTDPEDYGKLDRVIAKNVRQCAQHHIAIFSYVKKLEELFTYCFLAQFLTSVMVICIAGFSFIVTPVSDVLFGASVSYFAAAMVEICMYCIFGDELINQIRDACYLSEWNNCGPEIRKALFIIMERSKKPFVLTAGKFAILSRDSLLKLCKSSVSYFAVLRKLYGTEQ